MSTQRFIADLVALLCRLDRGTLEFEDPPPDGVNEGVMNAVAAFGEQALPDLHTALASAPGADYDPVHVIDTLAMIANSASAPYLIAFHGHGTYISSAAAIIALREMKTESAYLYLAELLQRYAAGDHRAVETRLELVVCCNALGEWPDPRAIPALEKAVDLTDNYPGLHEAACEALERVRDLR